MNLQHRKRFTDLEKQSKVAGGEGIVRDFGKVMYTLLYLKWITNKNLLYSTWNCSMLCANGSGRGFWGRMDTCICMALLST